MRIFLGFILFLMALAVTALSVVAAQTGDTFMISYSVLGWIIIYLCIEAYKYKDE